MHCACITLDWFLIRQTGVLDPSDNSAVPQGGGQRTFEMSAVSRVRFDKLVSRLVAKRLAHGKQWRWRRCIVDGLARTEGLATNSDWRPKI
jgi:hypothetical protein